MFRAVVLYEQEPDAERYQKHIDEHVTNVPGATFSHGKIFGAPIGDGRYHYFAEFAWPDRESFEEGTSSEAFAGSAKDAMTFGIPFHAYLLETD
jgi:hypothetical protein